jgi:pimeloyl-ACP methyl ester carboxylesterase
MGCLVASRFASQNRALTYQLLLYEPPLFTTIPGFETPSRRQEFYRRLYEQIAANPTGKLTVTRMLARVSKNWQRYLETDQAWLPIQKSLRNTIMQQKGYEELRDTTVRTDIVHGLFDVVVPSQNLRQSLADNANITFHKTTDRHRLSATSVRTLADIIASSAQLSDNKKA